MFEVRETEVSITTFHYVNSTIVILYGVLVYNIWYKRTKILRIKGGKKFQRH